MIRGVTTSIDVTGPAPLETAPAPLEMRPRLGLSLFWRTFFLLSLLLIGSIVAWLQTFRALEFEPRAVQTAQQIASLVNLSRAALVHSDSIARVSLIKTLADQEGVRILPREPTDRYATFTADELDTRVMDELVTRLGPGTVMAASVNNEEGLWVGFKIGGDEYWMLLDRSRLSNVGGRTWLIWLITAAGLSLAGAALIARLINRPLKQLSFAASRVRDGDFDASRLDEKAVTSEIREVNIGFNRMAQQLAKIEQDRAVMLAGISHDLRTPLSRLRLEAEMSVQDEEAKSNMAMDIDQLDAIIDKFMDYARPGEVKLVPVDVAQIVQREAAAFRDTSQIRIQSKVAPDTRVLADDVELGRVLQNLFENARRYGRSTDTGIARVVVSYARTGPWVIITVRDHGQGVDPKKIDQLTTPFFRGDAARTAATGAGLGLAIVEKALARMGGAFEITNAADGGLLAHIRLKRA